MRMLRWMVVIKIIEKIRNEEIKARTGRCDKHELENKRSEPEMFGPCREKDR